MWPTYPTHERFNGAALMTVRKVKNRIGGKPSELLLQWGRTDDSAEGGSRFPTMWFFRPSFNGAALMTVRKGEIQPAARAQGVALQWGRTDDSAEGAFIARKSQITGSFNGAALMTVRKA